MATVNLGAIRYNWKGAYSGSTAYVVNDVVSANGNSYICIQAGTGQAVGNATAYWNIMSSAGTNGTNGTDLTSTLTAQGDIVYRDGSGLAKLGAGTSGQFLKTQGTGANPVWGSIDPASIVAVGFAENSTRYSLSNSASTAIFTVSFTKTLSATASKIIVFGNIGGRGNYSDHSGCYFDCLTTGVTKHDTNDSKAFRGITMGESASNTRKQNLIVNQEWEDTTNLGAGSHTFEFGWRVRNGSSGEKPFLVINVNSGDDGRSHQTSSTFTFYEVLR